jgi:hypothetical protein
MKLQMATSHNNGGAYKAALSEAREIYEKLRDR